MQEETRRPAAYWERQSAIFNQYPYFCTLSLSPTSLGLHQSSQATSDARRNSKDLEPGRCKRSDGKKWRCSKAAVAPNHKYCDRHLNRGRGRTRRRSRKLVEPQPKTAADLTNHRNITNINNGDCSNFSPVISTSTTTAYPLFLDLLPTDDGDDAYFPSFSCHEPISSGMEEASFEDEWNQLLLKDIGFMTAGLTYNETDDGSVFRQDETPTAFIETSQSTVSNSLTLSMSMAATSLDMDPTENLPVSSDRELPPPPSHLPLSVAMAAGYILDNDLNMNVDEDGS